MPKHSDEDLWISKIMFKILIAIHKNKNKCMSTIARDLEISYAYMHKVCKKLDEHKLIIIKKVGRENNLEMIRPGIIRPMEHIIEAFKK